MISSSISNKLQSYRNQIRQKELDSFFAMKRRILMGEQIMQVQHHSFKIVFEQVIQCKNIQQNLLILSSLSFQRQLYTECADQMEADQLYYDIVAYLINVVKEHPTKSLQHQNKRITCLNIIANLLIDNQCPTSAIAPIVCEFLNDFYECFGMCGTTFLMSEMMEVGFLIANIIGNRRFGEESEEGCITFLFQWIQDILHIKQEKVMMSNMYAGLKILIIALQNRYKLSNIELPQLYKGQIMNCIETAINNQEIFQNLSEYCIKATDFLYHMVPIFLSICPYQWSIQFMNRLKRYFSSYRETLLKKLCLIAKRFLLFNDISFPSPELYQRAVQIRSRVREIIAQNLIQKLFWFSIDDQKQKQKKFDLLLCVIECDQENSAYYLDKLIESNIEMHMINMIGAKNQELYFMFFQLINIAKRLKMEQHFQRFLDTAEKYRIKGLHQNA